MDVDLSMDFEKKIPTNAPPELKALTEKALEANKAHQYALTKYAERLAAELQEIENLMDAVTTDDIDDERDVEVHIPGATKAMGPCPMSEFLYPNSPFFEHASRRSQYMSYTVDHPMKNRELDVLSEAVKAENLRFQAYESQKSGQDGAKTIDLETNTEGINWNNVAEKVSIACTVKRTADQCRIRWLGDRHPNINHSNWSSSELDKLKAIVSAQLETNDGKVDWVHVSMDLGTNRTPIDCMRRGIPRQRHIWHPEADEKLTEAVKLYGTDNWGIVARFVSEDATASQCSGRYSRAIDLSRKRGPWTHDEFERLKVAVAAYGNSWVEVAACIPGRTNEQCRERWTEHINQASATILWSEVDDKDLLDAVATMGNRWTAISTKIGNGSTGQQCRARWEKVKRLQDLRQAAAAGLSQPSSSQIVPPEPSCRPRKDVASGSANGTGGPTAPFTNQISPYPVRKKGKGKEKATEPPSDLASDAPAAATPSKTANRDVPMPENDTRPNKRAAGDATDQAPAAKKRKISTRSKDTTCSNATKSPASSLSTPSTRTSSRKKVANVNKPAPTRPQPRPRGRPKKAVLPPSFELTSEPPAADAVSRTDVPPTPDPSSSPSQTADPDAEAAKSSRPKPRPRGRPRKVVPPLEPSPPEPEPHHEHEHDASSMLSGVLTPAFSKAGTGDLIGSTPGGRGGGRGRGRGVGQGAAAHASTLHTPGRRQSARVAALQQPMAESALATPGGQEDKRS
ncbi:hypothetical protein D9615_000172 [Tricholomella constricta]|uniref:Uncharacterized protein n=1 Tax=Tricholomella constricta TaxID=117010 RepID=A0A8H5MBD6_9AGAR|nr:hypothetical protein D9615_000172 [Tricholomella constricta]